MNVKCLVCGRALRGMFFPYNMAFWRRAMTVYSFESDVYNNGEIYDVRAYMCTGDKEWANKNPLIAQMLLKSKIKALKQRDNE